MNQPIGLLPRKLLLGRVLLAITAAGAVAGLVFFGWSAKAKDDATVQLANGVQVTPIEIKPDDMAQLLQARIWKCDVIWPNTQRHYRAGIGLRRDGKLDKMLVGGFGLGPWVGSQHTQVTMGLAPVAGTLFEAKQLRYSLSTRGGTAGTGTISNPFIHAHGYIQDAEVVPSQNSVIVMSGNLKKTWISTPASQNEVALSLELTDTNSIK